VDQQSVQVLILGRFDSHAVEEFDSVCRVPHSDEIRPQTGVYIDCFGLGYDIELAAACQQELHPREWLEMACLARARPPNALGHYTQLA
jgi:hypothetical protein